MGKNVPWFTTMGGAYEHAAKHGSKPPYQLPDSWMKNKSAINPKTPYDTVSTPDIIGGNSGSPVINKAGEVVGIIFDGNIESLAWNFDYTDKVARAVEVDSRAITEALEEDLSRRCAAERADGRRQPAGDASRIRKNQDEARPANRDSKRASSRAPAKPRLGAT